MSHHSLSQYTTILYRSSENSTPFLIQFE